MIFLFVHYYLFYFLYKTKSNKKQIEISNTSKNLRTVNKVLSFSNILHNNNLDFRSIQVQLCIVLSRQHGFTNGTSLCYFVGFRYRWGNSEYYCGRNHTKHESSFSFQGCWCMEGSSGTATSWRSPHRYCNS